jgi:hypothetical protein
MDQLGYDDSVQVVPRPGARYMAMQRSPNLADVHFDYIIEAQLHLTETLFGCGSNIRRVCHRDRGDSYIVKDTWHNVACALTEGQILRVISEVQNVPRVVEEYVVGENEFSSTYESRSKLLEVPELYSALLDGRFHDRVHLRLLMKASPIQVITKFKSRVELAQALIDCVNGMSLPNTREVCTFIS